MDNYPIFKNEYISENNEIETHSKFKNYLSFTDDLVNNIQFNSTNKSEIPLSFYPLAILNHCHDIQQQIGLRFSYHLL